LRQTEKAKVALIADPLQIDCRSLFFAMAQKSHLAEIPHPTDEVPTA